MPLSTPLSVPSQKPLLGIPEIDWTHPLAGGLCAVVLANEWGSAALFEPLSSSVLSLRAGTPWDAQSGVYGLKIHVPGGSPGAEVVCPNALKLQFPITLVFKGAAYAAGADSSGLFGVTTNNTDATPWTSYELDIRGAGARLGWNTSGSTFQQIDAAGVMPTSGPAWVAGVLDNGAQSIYVQNPSTPAGTAAISGTIGYTATSLFHVGAYTGPVARNPAVLFEVGHIYNRALSTAELAWLKAEPYAMLQPRLMQRWFAAGGPVGYILPPEFPGVFNLDVRRRIE